LTLDAQTWRVTVFVDKKDIIQEITQEVAVGLKGYENGWALQHDIPEGYPIPDMWDGVTGKCYYTDKKGKLKEWKPPKRNKK
jgi:hypothetical protein